MDAKIDLTENRDFRKHINRSSIFDEVKSFILSITTVNVFDGTLNTWTSSRYSKLEKGQDNRKYISIDKFSDKITIDTIDNEKVSCHRCGRKLIDGTLCKKCDEDLYCEDTYNSIFHKEDIPNIPWE